MVNALRSMTKLTPHQNSGVLLQLAESLMNGVQFQRGSHGNRKLIKKEWALRSLSAMNSACDLRVSLELAVRSEGCRVESHSTIHGFSMAPDLHFAPGTVTNIL